LLLLGPCVLYLVMFLGVPIGLWLTRAFFDPGPTLEHVRHLVRVPAYVRVLGTTFRYSVIVTGACLVLGYPLAYYLSGLPLRRRNLLVLLVLLPFWTSALVRTFVWFIILSPAGPINRVLEAVGFVRGPLQLEGNAVGSLIGMIYVMLPYTVLVLMAVMQGIDRSLVTAAATMGARPFQAFRRVFLPLSFPGVAGAGLLIFMNSLGFYITPAMLGGPSDILIAQAVQQQITLTLNWGFAALLALTLLVSTVLVYALYVRVGALGSIWSMVSTEIREPRRPHHTVSTWEATAERCLRTLKEQFADRVDGLERRAFLAVDWLRSRFGPAVAGGQRATNAALPAFSWLLLGYLVLPIVVVIPMSFGASTFLEFPPSQFSLRWYHVYMTSPEWLTATWHSVEAATGAALLSTTLGTIACFGFAQASPRWRLMLLPVFLLPMIVPTIVTAVASFYFLAPTPLYNTVLSLVLVYAALGVPFVIITVAPVLQGFDRRLEQAARTLGAGPWKTFWAVIFPLIRPGILAGLLFAFLVAFDDLIVALFLTGGPFRTLPRVMWDDIEQNVHPTLAAVATLLVAVTSLLLLAVSRVRRTSAYPEPGVVK